MFAPHSVTIYNVDSDGRVYVTFLDGVLFDAGQSGKVTQNGVAADDRATLYIPFDCKAVDAVSGQRQQYCPPKIYDARSDKDSLWTVGPRNRRSGVDCFFIKGLIAEPESDFASLNDRYEDVFRVSSVETRDFGSPEMQHWQVGGK